MIRRITTMGVVALMCTGMAVALAADPPMKKDPGKKADKAKTLRVYAPYHDLDLTDEQKPLVGAIQAEYRAKIASLEQEMDEKILAHLTAAQVAELQSKEAEAERKRKEAYQRAAEKRKAAAAADGKS